MTSPFDRTGKSPLIMGIINVTLDSFSGDGVWRNDNPLDAALKQTNQMIEDGADILDIGGESTRPNATAVSAEEEKERVLPLIRALHQAYPALTISVDTMKAEVARASLEAGATIINDVSGMTQKPEMRKLAAETGAYLVQMHNRANTDKTMSHALIGGEYKAPVYQDVVEETCKALEELAQQAMNDGVAHEKIILDPGIGFGKSLSDNMRLINELDKIHALGFPVLLGPSRKSFIGRALETESKDRLEGTASAIAIGTLRGADILRVHDVRFMARVAKMTAMIRES